jgi:hypothetical protein
LAYDEKPTVESIHQITRYLQDLWSRTHNKWREIDSYYQQEFKLWPEGMSRPEWLKPARSRSIVDHAVDHQLAYEPIVHRFPVGQTEASERRADEVEPAMKAILDEASLFEPSMTWKAIGKHLLLYGYAVIEDGLDSSCMNERREKPRKGRNEPQDEFDRRVRIHQNAVKSMMPFRTRAPHPSRVLLDPMEKEPRMAVKHAYRRSIDLEEITSARMTGARAKRGEVHPWKVTDNPFEMVMVDEFWSECWHAMVANDELLFVEKNTWGFIPYSHAFSGYGQEITSIEEYDPSYLAVGILEPVMPALKAQAQAVAGRHNALMEATFNPTGTVMDASELEEQLSRGDVIEMGNKSDVWKMEIPQLPRWMFASEEWLDRDIELGTFSRALAGVREQGVSTVGQQAILTTAAGRKFVSPTKQLEHLATKSAEHILQWVDVLELDLRIRGNRLNRQMLESDYSCSVSFELIDPVLQLQFRELGMREVQQGLKSKETYWSSDARLEDSTGEQKRLLEDLIREDPRVQELMAKEVAREAGLQDLLDQEEERAKAQQMSAMDGGAMTGPDGMPIQQTMGSGAGRPPRNPLTPDTARPSRIGQELAR